MLGVFILSYDYLYRVFLAPRYSYLGFAAESHDPYEFLFACAASVLALFVLPTSMRRFSDYFLWFFFAVTFVPGVITVSRMGTLPNGGYGVITLMFLSLLIMASITRLAPVQFLQAVGPRRFSNTNYLVLISALSLLALILVFGSIMSVSTYDTLYDQRARAAEAGGGRMLGYLLNWTAYAFLPMLFAVGIIKKRIGLVALGAIGFFIIFMINGAKIVFVSAFLIAGVRILFSAALQRRPGRLMLIPVLPMLVVIAFLPLLHGGSSQFIDFIVAQVVMRALAIQATMITISAEFFANHPLTYMSNVSGVSYFVHYPYDRPLGFVIGTSIIGGDGFNANAGFLITDGIAAFGLAGMPMAAFLAALLLVFINMVSARTNLVFICIALTPFCLATANTSFLTAFVTGGGLVATILASKLPASLQA
ncbi:hypothetical protein [Thioclava sp.]|uniref:hypothetical protein n=1 Tax=Thioclava sp. TaxID=1933450 RepID=UPI003241D63F